MDTSFTFVVGSAPLDNSLEFRALSVVVDNPTNQWVRLDSLGVSIPQYTLGATYPLPGTTRAQASFTAPAGQVEPPIIAAQAATITFYSLALPSSAGVGMLGGRAPYYDRNPSSFTLAFSLQSVAPHALTIRASYTVPTGRRAYIEVSECTVIFESAGDLALGSVQSFFNFTPNGGSAASVVTAFAEGLAPVRTTARTLVGTSVEMQAGDRLDADTVNLYTATTLAHILSVKGTEFDA